MDIMAFVYVSPCWYSLTPCLLQCQHDNHVNLCGGNNIDRVLFRVLKLCVVMDI